MKKITSLLLFIIIPSISFAQDLEGEFQVDNCNIDGLIDIFVAVDSGVPPYSYTWNIAGLTGNYLSDVPLGYYCVIVFDALGDSIVICEDIEEELSYPCSDNLVPDPSFEVYTDGNYSSFDYLGELDNWWTAANTPDYHNQNHIAGSNLTSLEDCPLGNGQTNCGVPVHGQAVLGIYKANEEEGSKEWAATHLNEAMQQDSLYKVSFWIQNKKDDPDFIMETSNWGVFFSNTGVPVFDPDILDFDLRENQFVRMEEMLDSNDWRYVEWIYKADADYEYIYVGYMGNPSDAIINAFSELNLYGFYVWFDQIQVIPLADDVFVVPIDEYILCNGDSVEISVSSSIPVLWSVDGEVLGTGNSIWVNPDSNTTYYINYGGTSYYPLIDSIHVIVTGCACDIGPDSISISIQNPGDCYNILNATSGFEHYIWNTGDTTQSITVTSESLYNVTGYNENGCPSYANILIELTPLPISIDIEDSIYCNSTIISAVGDFVEYMWNTGDTTQSINANEGWYTVIANNEEGCISEEEVYVPQPVQPFNESQICMVTLDEELEKNVLVYEADYTVNIDSVLFYHLNNITSEFELIGSNFINDSSVFVDMDSNPSQLNGQYKIAIKDICGSISDQSLLHQTMLLQANLGFGGAVNLFWNAYIGFDYPNFGIYRSVEGGDYYLIANVSNNTYAYTDINPPLGEKKYQIRVEKDTPCNPQSGFLIVENEFDYVGSNPVLLTVVGLNEIGWIDDVTIFPNPFKDALTIEREHNLDKMKIELIDVYGRVLTTYNINAGETNMSISTGHILPGVYYIRFNQLMTKRVVKQ